MPNFYTDLNGVKRYPSFATNTNAPSGTFRFCELCGRKHPVNWANFKAEPALCENCTENSTARPRRLF